MESRFSNEPSGGLGEASSANTPKRQEFVYWVSVTTLHSFCIRKQNQFFSYPNPTQYPDYTATQLEIAGLGSARSVRILNIAGNVSIAVGLMGGIIVWEMGIPRTFRYPYEATSSQGYNAIAYSHPFLYATHSEYGLVRWDMRQQPSKGESIQPKLFYPHQTMRAIQIVEDIIYLACDEKIYALSAKNPQKGILATYSCARYEITGIVPKKDRIYACNSQGELLYWPKESQSVIKVLKYPQPIFMLRPNHQTEEIVLSAKEFALISMVQATNSFKVKRFLADQPVSWGVGCGKTFVGVGEDLQTLYFWEDSLVLEDTSVPYNRDIGLYHQIEVSERICDLDIASTYF